MRKRGWSINWRWSGLTALCTEIGLKVRGETCQDGNSEICRVMVCLVVMLTILMMPVMVVMDELHGWPAPDELLTGVVGWCSVKSAATPVWCVACSMWGYSWATFGKCGGSWGCPPTSSFDIHQRGSTTRCLQHTRGQSPQSRSYNPQEHG